MAYALLGGRGVGGFLSWQGRVVAGGGTAQHSLMFPVSLFLPAAAAAAVWRSSSFPMST